MAEYRDNNSKYPETNYNNEQYYPPYTCECCHCKKIFMMLTVLILTFIAGILVGNSGRYHYIEDYDTLNYVHNHRNMSAQKFLRGIHPVQAPGYNAARQSGGFVIDND